jgi:hypothetical protein
MPKVSLKGKWLCLALTAWFAHRLAHRPESSCAHLIYHSDWIKFFDIYCAEIRGAVVQAERGDFFGWVLA